MSDISVIIGHYGEIRERLINPPNAVEDIGIDLKRKPVDNSPKEPEVLVNHLTAEVTIHEICVNKPPRLNDILRAVCKYYHKTSAEIKGASRTIPYVRPRHVFCYLAIRHGGYSFPTIGRFLGGRDHTTVLHAVRKMKERILVDEDLRKNVVDIEKMLCVEQYD